MKRPGRLIYSVLSLLVLVLGFGLGRAGHAATESSTVRTVNGEVLAVVTDERPQVIVVKTFIAGKKELIVGATLDSDATVSRGKKRVALSDIRIGETVSLAYHIDPEGPAAKSVHAHEVGVMK